MSHSPEIHSRGGRRLTTLRSWLYQLALPVAWVLVKFWWKSCKIVAVEGAHHLSQALASGPVIPVYWHGRQLFCVHHLMSLRALGLNIGFVISPSVDGEIPARLARALGAEVIRGSSNQTGARVLRDYYLAVKQGFSPAITPDGPKGPVYSFKQGPVLLSQMTQRPIVPLSFTSLRGFQFRAWDKFWLPLPFSRVAITVGAPTQVERGANEADIAKTQAFLETQMMELQERARELLVNR